MLIGGAPGTGKSTVATQVAHRLGITRIVSTDAVRQVMRAVIARELVPHVHTSSFDAAATVPPDALRQPRRAHPPSWASCSRPRPCASACAASSIARSPSGSRWCSRACTSCRARELVPVDCARATVVEVMLVVARPAGAPVALPRAGRAHGRRAAGGALPAAFEEIRKIQAHLLEAAARNGVPVVEARPHGHRGAPDPGHGAGARGRGRYPSAVSEPGNLHRCVCTDLVSVTERAALAGGRSLGSGDEHAAREAGDAAARGGARRPRARGPRGHRRRARLAAGRGRVVGRGGPLYELAVDSVQGESVVARGGNGAISILAAGAPDSLRPVPAIYMKKIAVGAGRLRPTSRSPTRWPRRSSTSPRPTGAGRATSRRSCSTATATRT